MNIQDYLFLLRWLDLGDASYYRIKWDWDASGNLLYIGFAKKGSLTSALAWLIVKFTMDDTINRAVAMDTSPSNKEKWDNRAGLTYN